MNIDNLKACPFCGGNRIKYSIKTTTSGFNATYHFQMYCNDCHCYGPRVFWKPEDSKQCVSRTQLGKDESFKKAALDSWNNRVSKDVEPVRHGHWIKVLDYVSDDDGKPVMNIGMHYECSVCGRYEEEKQPYCNCGAKMDGNEGENNG